MEAIGEIIFRLNTFLDKLLPWMAVVALSLFNAYMFIKWIWDKTKGQKAEVSTPIQVSRAVYLLGISVGIQVLIITILYISPMWARWLEIFGAVCGYIYFLTRNASGSRGLYTAAGHLIIIFLCWWIGSWLGIVFISTPIFAAFYYWLYRIALVIVPASDPESSAEALTRFKMLAWYMWGLQFPVWATKDDLERVAEERIKGDLNKSIGQPGMIWLHSNQAIGITRGIQFSRVEGPGVIFTKTYERPYQVVDLRTQIRTTEIQAISKDGIPYKATVLVVFNLDKDAWTEEQYKTLRSKNSLLRGAQSPDRISGSYRYSRSRVTAALSIEGIRHTSVEGEARPIVHWDHWVVNTVAEAARNELSHRPLDELWRAANDGKDANASDVIANNIKSASASRLKEKGINLVAARVVNFNFEGKEASKVLQQQIDTWESLRNQEIAKTKAEAAATSVQIRQDAFAYARSKLLSSIAQGVGQMMEKHKDLPVKYVVAVRYLTAIEDWIGQQEGEGETRLQALRSRLKDLNFPHSGQV